MNEPDINLDDANPYLVLRIRGENYNIDPGEVKFEVLEEADKKGIIARHDTSWNLITTKKQIRITEDNTPHYFVPNPEYLRMKGVDTQDGNEIVMPPKFIRNSEFLREDTVPKGAVFTPGEIPMLEFEEVSGETLHKFQICIRDVLKKLYNLDITLLATMAVWKRIDAKETELTDFFIKTLNSPAPSVSTPETSTNPTSETSSEHTNELKQESNSTPGNSTT